MSYLITINPQSQISTQNLLTLFLLSNPWLVNRNKEKTVPLTLQKQTQVFWEFWSPFLKYPWIVYKGCWSQLVIQSLIISPEITIAWRGIPGKRGASCQVEGVPGSMSDVSAEWTILLNSGMLGASTLDAKVLLVLMVTSFPKRS